MPILFLIVGFWIVVFIVNKFYQKVWNKNLTSDIEFLDDHVTEGQEGLLRETITNNKRLPVPVLHAKFQTSRNLDFHQNENVSVSDLTYKNDLFAVMPYQRISRTLKFTAKKRGCYHIDHLDLVSSFLFFESFSYEKNDVDTSICVYPRGIDGSITLDFTRQVIWSLETRSRLYEDPFSFAGIRDYMPGDPMKRINWNATAKTGDLRVNVYDHCAGQPVVILLNLQNSITWHTDALLEESIRIAVTIAGQLISSGISVQILTNYDNAGALAEEPGASLENILRKMAMVDLGVPAMDYAAWVERYVLPNMHTDYLYTAVSYDESVAMCAASSMIAAAQDGLCLYRPSLEGMKLPDHSGNVRCFERKVSSYD